VVNVTFPAARAVRAAGLAALLAASGCAAPAPAPAKPRTASSRYYNLSSQPSRPVVVLGHLDNPARSPIRWRDIGAGMSDALSREMRAEGVYDAWINARVAREVRSILEGPPATRPARFAKLAAENPDIRYILIGQVTDFQHLGEPMSTGRGATTPPPPADAKKGESPPPFDAIVAIDFVVVDIVEQRAILADHVMAQVPAGYQLSGALYGDMAFGSYRFWHTPLGQASQRTILEVIRRVDELPVPDMAPSYVAANSMPHVEPIAAPPDAALSPVAPAPAAPSNFYRQAIRVERQLEARRVQVSAGRSATLREGETFYVCRYDAAGGRMIAINDRDTGLPLRARIVDATPASGTAFLLGLSPDAVDLAGAMLTSSPGEAGR